MWQTEVIPPALVRGTFVILYKKGLRDNFGNYRAIGLMCHSYKLLSVLVLHRMRDAVESRLAETQAGFCCVLVYFRHTLNTACNIESSLITGLN